MGLLSQTNMLERIFLFSLLILMPLQTNIPRVGGASILFILYGVIGAYLFVLRPQQLRKVLWHPVILAAFGFVAISVFMEFAHGSGVYSVPQRIGFMVVGGVFVASLCRDRRALSFAIYGCMLGGLLVSGILFLSVYGTLSSVKATDFEDASIVRGAAFAEGNTIEGDLNQLALFSAQGALVALVLALPSGAVFKRLTFVTIGAFCLIGTFLPMSRGSVLFFILTGAAIGYRYGIMRPNIIIGVGILAVVSAIWIPDVVLSRFQVSAEKGSKSGKVEGRVRLFNAAMKTIPEVGLTGVGVGHYFGDWGHQTKFYDPKGGIVKGPHNSYAQVILFWGLPGLFTLLMIIWKAYRYFPKFPRTDPLGLCLLGIVLTTLMETMVIHTIEGKEFSIAIGLIVGSSIWIWPGRKDFRTIYASKVGGNVNPIQLQEKNKHSSA